MSIIINALNKFGQLMASVTCMATILSVLIMAFCLSSTTTAELSSSTPLVQVSLLMMGLSLVGLMTAIATAAIIAVIEPRK